MHGQCDARPTVTFLATERHRRLAGTKLYCMVTEAHWCEQLAQSCYSVDDWPGVELVTFRSEIQCPNHSATKPLMCAIDIDVSYYHYVWYCKKCIGGLLCLSVKTIEPVGGYH